MSGLYIVTGANRGLGRATAEQLLRMGKRVILACREPEQLQGVFDNRPNATLMQLDITNDLSVVQFSHELHQLNRPVEALINNAGVFLETNWNTGGLTALRDANLALIDQTINVNTYGVIRLYQAIHHLLQEKARIVNVSSGMGQLSEMNGGYPGYRISKAAVNVLTKLMAEELAPKQIIVSSVCPGWVKTDMGGPGAERDLEQGIETIVWAACNTDHSSGRFWRDKKEISW